MRTYIRCIVKGDYPEAERKLFCTEEESGAIVVVVLRDSWEKTHVYVGDTVNVDWPFEDGPLPARSRIVVSATKGMLVVNPDVLVPVSEVAHACQRTPCQTYVAFEAREFKPVHNTTGIIVHELLLKALADPEASSPNVRRVLAENSKCIAQNGHTDDEVRSQLALFPDACASFLRIFEGRADESPRRGGGLTCVDVNEEVLSPRYGLIGVPDVTVGIPAYGGEGAGSGMRIGSLDIKTGRPRPEHETQVTLYGLMLSDKYGGLPSTSLIYYAQMDQLVAAHFTRHVALEAMTTRNMLAALDVLRRRDLEHWTGALPTTYLSGEIQAALDQKLLVALNYRAAAISHSYEATSLKNARIVTARVGDDECAYFADQSRAIALEEGAAERAMVELWTNPAHAREAEGKALSDLVIAGDAFSPASARARANRLSFTRRIGGRSFLDGPFAEGDAVVINVEPDLHTVSRGIVREVLPHRLTVSTAKLLDVNGVLLSARRTRDGPPVFALDRDERAAGTQQTIRHNLVRLFRKDQKRLRQFIVRRKAPEVTPAVPSSPSQAFNAEQQAAIERVLAVKDYALIRAPRGTGVMRTVAQCVRRLVEEGKSVLLAAHSNAVLDALICRLDAEPFGVLRLGTAEKIHADAKKHTLSGGEQGAPRSADEYRQRIHEPSVVAITCLSVKDTVFCGRKFDVCIILDAPRVTMPTCLGPLFHARAFVLVGDERQLGPIVHAPSARRDGLAKTLFERLCKAHPIAVVDLTMHYRMSAAMTPSNVLSYGGRLVCATAHPQRDLPLPSKTRCSFEKCLFDLVLDPSCCTFVDTDCLLSNGSPDDSIGAQCIDKMCGALTAAGVDQDRIAVLAYYRSHVSALKHALRNYPRVDVRTIDSDGKVKDCVVVYMARKKPANKPEPCLEDPRRMTTALTQAHCKLLVVGSRSALGTVPDIHKLLLLHDRLRWSVAPTWDQLDHSHFHPRLRSTPDVGCSSSPALRGFKRHRTLDAEYAGTARPHKRAATGVELDPAVTTASFTIHRMCK